MNIKDKFYVLTLPVVFFLSPLKKSVNEILQEIFQLRPQF